MMIIPMPLYIFANILVGPRCLQSLFQQSTATTLPPSPSKAKKTLCLTHSLSLPNTLTTFTSSFLLLQLLVHMYTYSHFPFYSLTFFLYLIPFLTALCSLYYNSFRCNQLWWRKEVKGPRIFLGTQTQRYLSYTEITWESRAPRTSILSIEFSCCPFHHQTTQPLANFFFVSKILSLIFIAMRHDHSFHFYNFRLFKFCFFVHNSYTILTTLN